MWCTWKGEGKRQTVDTLFISVTASFYEVLFVLHLWIARQDIKIYGQIKRKINRASEKGGDKMIILHGNCWVPDTKIGCDLNGVPGGRCVVWSPEVFGPGTENLYTLCKIVWFDLDFWLGFLLVGFFPFFSYYVALLNAFTYKKPLGERVCENTLKVHKFRISCYFLIQQIQAIDPHNILVLGRMPWLDCVTSICRHVWLAGVAFLEPLSGVSSCSPDWWMSHQNLCFVCGFYQSSSGSRQYDWLTPYQVSGRRSWSEVTQVTAEE